MLLSFAAYIKKDRRSGEESVGYRCLISGRIRKHEIGTNLARLYHRDSSLAERVESFNAISQAIVEKNWSVGNLSKGSGQSIAAPVLLYLMGRDCPAHDRTSKRMPMACTKADLVSSRAQSIPRAIAIISGSLKEMMETRVKINDHVQPVWMHILQGLGYPTTASGMIKFKMECRQPFDNRELMRFTALWMRYPDSRLMTLRNLVAYLVNGTMPPLVYSFHDGDQRPQTDLVITKCDYMSIVMNLNAPTMPTLGGADPGRLSKDHAQYAFWRGEEDVDMEEYAMKVDEFCDSQFGVVSGTRSPVFSHRRIADHVMVGTGSQTMMIKGRRRFFSAFEIEVSRLFSPVASAIAAIVNKRTTAPGSSYNCIYPISNMRVSERLGYGTEYTEFIASLFFGVRAFDVIPQELVDCYVGRDTKFDRKGFVAIDYAATFNEVVAQMGLLMTKEWYKVFNGVFLRACNTNAIPLCESSKRLEWYVSE
jgi:hypothetical protein